MLTARFLHSWIPPCYESDAGPVNASRGCGRRASYAARTVHILAHLHDCIPLLPCFSSRYSLRSPHVRIAIWDYTLLFSCTVASTYFLVRTHCRRDTVGLMGPLHTLVCTCIVSNMKTLLHRNWDRPRRSESMMLFGMTAMNEGGRIYGLKEY